MASYTQPVVFQLNGLSYGIDIKRVSSIENSVNFTPVPNTAPYIRGIMNLRGNVIPVFDLKERFGMDSGTEGAAIVVSFDKTTIGIAVDTVQEIDDIAPEHIVPMPTMIKKQDTMYYDRVANVNGKLVVLLDIDALIPEKDQEEYGRIAEEMAEKNGD